MLVTNQITLCINSKNFNRSIMAESSSRPNGISVLCITTEELTMLNNSLDKIHELCAYRLIRLLDVPNTSRIHSTLPPSPPSPTSSPSSTFDTTNKLAVLQNAILNLTSEDGDKNESTNELMTMKNNPILNLIEKAAELENNMQIQIDCLDDFKLQVEKELNDKDVVLSELEDQNDLLFNEVKRLEQELNSVGKGTSEMKEVIKKTEKKEDKKWVSNMKEESMNSENIAFINLKRSFEKERAENKWLSSECLKLREKLNVEINKRPSLGEEKDNKKQLQPMLGKVIELENKWKMEAEKALEENRRMKMVCAEMDKECKPNGVVYENVIMEKDYAIKSLSSSLLKSAERIKELEKEMEEVKMEVKRGQEERKKNEAAMALKCKEANTRTEEMTSFLFAQQRKHDQCLIDLVSKVNDLLENGCVKRKEDNSAF